MAKSSRRASGKAAAAGTATIHDQKLTRGEGGELHQIAQGDTPVLTTAQGGPVSDDQNYAQDRPARTDPDRRFSFPREDLPFRPRADSRARGACARLRRARLLRELQIAVKIHPRRHVSARRRTDAGLRAVLDRRRQQGVVRPRPRRARLCGEALYAGRQLGHRRQQHPGLLHPGRHQVSRHHPRRQGGARQRLSAGAVGARQFLGLHHPDARKHAHDHVGDVGPRDPALVSLHGRVWRPHLPPGQCQGRIRPSSSFTGSRSSACSRCSGTRRSRSTAPIRTFIAAICGPRSRPAIFRNGSCSSSCSTRHSPTVSISTCSIRPRSFRRRCCRRCRSVAWCSTACRTISLPRPSRSRS